MNRPVLLQRFNLSYAMKSQVLIAASGRPFFNLNVTTKSLLFVGDAVVSDDDSVRPIQVYPLPTGLMRHRDDGFCKTKLCVVDSDSEWAAKS